jgi:hypothetical protein
MMKGGLRYRQGRRLSDWLESRHNNGPYCSEANKPPAADTTGVVVVVMVVNDDDGCAHGGSVRSQSSTAEPPASVSVSVSALP